MYNVCVVVWCYMYAVLCYLYVVCCYLYIVSCGVTLYTVCEVVRFYRMWCGVVLHVRGVVLFVCGVMLHVHCLVWCYMYNVCQW